MLLKEIYVELNNRCLLSCKHGSSSASNMGNKCLATERVKELLVEARIMGAQCFSISGGEPLLYDGLLDVLEKAHDLGFKTKIYTCGVINNDKEVVSIGEETFSAIQSYNVDRVIFSLHGAVSSTHDYITGVNGSFALVMESIRRAIRLGLIVEVHTVPMSVNFREIPGIIRLAEELGVQKVSLLRLVPQGRCNENLHLLMDKDQTKEFVNIVESIDSGFVTIRKGAPYRCLFHSSSPFCSAGKDKVLIGPDGSVHPCEAFKSVPSASNINSNSLSCIWKHDDMLIRLRKHGLSSISVCDDCSDWPVCRGGCPGQRWLKYDDLSTGPDPICIM